MALSISQKIQIEKLIDEMENRNGYKSNSINIATGRAKKLKEHGFFLEIFFIYSQVIEHDLKLTIDFYNFRRRILLLIDEKDIYKDVNLRSDEDMPLGALINVLKKLSLDSTMLRRLDMFNELRIECIHHIFDGTKEINIFEEKVRNYLQGSDFSILIKSISKVQHDATLEIKKIVLQYAKN